MLKILLNTPEGKRNFNKKDKLGIRKRQISSFLHIKKGGAQTWPYNVTKTGALLRVIL